MQISSGQYRGRMYHIEMSTSYSTDEDTQVDSINTDPTQMGSTDIGSSAVTRIQFPRSLSRACLYHADMYSSDDSPRVSASTHQDQTESSGIESSSGNRMQNPQSLGRELLHHRDKFSSDDTQREPTNMRQGQSLLQEHKNRSQLTCQEILYDLLENQRVALSSYINVLKKRLRSSFGVIKTPVPGWKVGVACHPPSK